MIAITCSWRSLRMAWLINEKNTCSISQQKNANKPKKADAALAAASVPSAADAPSTNNATPAAASPAVSPFTFNCCDVISVGLRSHCKGRRKLNVSLLQLSQPVRKTNSKSGSNTKKKNNDNNRRVPSTASLRQRPRQQQLGRRIGFAGRPYLVYDNKCHNKHQNDISTLITRSEPY